MVKSFLQGGVKNRLGIVGGSSSKHSPPASPLGKFFLNLHRKGVLSASDVGEGCSAASSSSAVPDDVKRLCNAQPKQQIPRGRRRKLTRDSRNSHRVVTGHLRRGAQLLEPYYVQGPCWDKLRNKCVDAKFAFLPIHETMWAISESQDMSRWCSCSPDQDMFKTRMAQSKSTLGMDDSVNLDDCFGFGVWGDSAPFARLQSVFMLHFLFLTGTDRRRYPICAIAKSFVCQCGCFGRHTFDFMFNVIAWSCEALVIGKFPACDHNGQPFPKGSWRHRMAGKSLPRGFCVAKYGDWAWYKQVLGLRGWRGETADKKCCWMCGAGFASQNCFDFTTRASWRSTFVSMVDFWSDCVAEGRFISTMWKIPGMRIEFVRPDWMHVVDIGINLLILGSVWYECFKSLGGSFSKHIGACSRLLNVLKVAAMDLGVQVPIAELTIGMFRYEKKKKASARLKAAESRYLMPIVEHMLEHFFECQNPHAKLRLQCVRALCDCHRELENWNNDDSPARLGAAGRRHLMLYGELRKQATDQKLYMLMPKHHIFVHICEDSKVNPRLEWNYGDEDAIGEDAEMATSVNIASFQHSWIDKYRNHFRC